MTPRYLRIVLMGEFLLAVIAIFTAWSEIGGQAVLDAMPWGWKFGLGIGLAAALTLYSNALCGSESVWNAHTAKWLTLMLAILLAMGVVTFYYAVQVQDEPPEDPNSSATSMSWRVGTQSPKRPCSIDSAVRISFVDLHRPFA